MNLREPTIKRVVQLMKDPKKGVSIKDRTFHFQVFSECFVGQDFVNWALLNGVADSRDHAVLLGQDILDRGFIFHASNDQPFRDGYFFYTFQKFPEISDAELDIIVIRMKAHPTGVSIQDRSHHLRNYRDCFVGAEAVDWLIKNVPKYAITSKLAVKLGQEMMNKGLMHSATQHPFTDGPDFYYFQKNVQSGYLGKLSKERTEWKIRWFAIKDVKEKKLWYYNSPRDPVPRDFIPLSGACLRVVLDQEIGYFEICTALRIFSLRPTSSTLLARWVTCLSEYVGYSEFEDNLRMERSERSISVHECGLSSKFLKEHHFPTIGLSLGEVVDSGLLLENNLTNSTDYVPASNVDYLHNNHTNGRITDANSEGMTTPKKLELMKDDLDIFQIDDTPFPSPKVDLSEPQYQTLYEDGFIGEGNYLPHPSFALNPCNFEECRDEDNEQQKEEDAQETEMKALIARLSQHLSTTDTNSLVPLRNTLIPITHETDVLPDREYNDPNCPQPNSRHSSLNYSHSHSQPSSSSHSHSQSSSQTHRFSSTGRTYQGFHFL